MSLCNNLLKVILWPSKHQTSQFPLVSLLQQVQRHKQRNNRQMVFINHKRNWKEILVCETLHPPGHGEKRMQQQQQEKVLCTFFLNGDDPQLPATRSHSLSLPSFSFNFFPVDRHYCLRKPFSRSTEDCFRKAVTDQRSAHMSVIVALTITI